MVALGGRPVRPFTLPGVSRMASGDAVVMSLIYYGCRGSGGIPDRRCPDPSQFLEHEPEAHLQAARIVTHRGSADLRESRITCCGKRGDAHVRVREERMVRCIERFHPELDILAFADAGLLDQRE